MKRRKLLSILLTLAMLLSLLPAVALSAAAVLAPTEVSDWIALRNTLAIAGTVSVKLTADIAAPSSGDAKPLAVPVGTTATLDLNGYDIDIANAFNEGIIVEGELNLVDGSEKADGVIRCAQYGGVWVRGGTLTMAGGTISENYCGVYVSGSYEKTTDQATAGSFKMTGGKISGNSYDGVRATRACFSSDGSSSEGKTKPSSFIMSGGTISGNGTETTAGVFSGVSIFGSSFEMTDGIITGNDCGVTVETVAGQEGASVVGYNFEMSGGTISGNEEGGVKIEADGSFNMTGGLIEKNGNPDPDYTSESAVGIDGGRFTMSGGKIKDNYGNGVLVNSVDAKDYDLNIEYKAAGSFAMTGGEISGNGESGVAVEGSAFLLTDGLIKGNCFGVALVGGAVQMEGGTITGNVRYFPAENDDPAICEGCGVYVEDGKFTMTGGTISDNGLVDVKGYEDPDIEEEPVPRAGIYVCGTGKCDLKGGTVSGNGDHGVWTLYGGEFHMNGGKIEKSVFNGVYAYGEDYDGEYEDDDKAGFFLSGSPTFANNTYSDIYLAKGENIQIEGELTLASAGVDIEDYPTEDGDPRVITEGLPENGKTDSFTSVNELYAVVSVKGEAAIGCTGETPTAFTVTLYTAMGTWQNNTYGKKDTSDDAQIAFKAGAALPGNTDVTRRLDVLLGWVNMTDVMNAQYENDDARMAAIMKELEDGAVLTALPTTAPETDQLYLAKWEKHSFDVLLDPAGGVWDDKKIDADKDGTIRWPFEEHTGGFLASAEDLTYEKNGVEYILLGWADADAGEDAPLVKQLPEKTDKDLTYKAVWKARTSNKVLITYLPGEGEGFAYQTEADVDTTLTVLAYDAEELDFKAPSGYKFDQWAYKCGNDTGTLNPGDSYYVVDNDVTFTALWVKDSSGDTPVSYGGGAETYKITVLETTHGTVTPSAKTASPGTKIKLTVAPDSGFALGEISAKGTAGATVELTKNDDGTYSFTMPAQNVEITAAFVPTESLCDGGEGCPLKKYDDLDTKAWYHDGVHYVLENDIMDDLGNGRFGPNDKVTRAVAVTAIWRLEGRPATDFAMTFEDVPADAPYAEAVRWAQSVGIANGYDAKTFGPDDTLTREQFAAFFYRYAQMKGMGFTGMWAFRLDFPDAGSISDWAYEAMSWMVMQGIINGMDGILNPQGFATRAQIATMIERFSHL